jgi:outer membrane immunogenic protein
MTVLHRGALTLSVPQSATKDLSSLSVLMYGTGGLAYGRVKASTSISQSNNDCILSPGNCIGATAATAGSLSETRTGWTVGGGFEWMFWQRWSAKIEYLYYDLGSVTFNNGQLVTSPGNAPFGPAIVASQSTTKFSGNIARLGVNYHF